MADNNGSVARKASEATVHLIRDVVEECCDPEQMADLSLGTLT